MATIARRPFIRVVKSSTATFPTTAISSSRLTAIQLLNARAIHVSTPVRESKPQRDEIKSAPGWREENATEAEADVKADREPLPKDVEELQHESIENLKAKESLFEKVQEETQHLKEEAHNIEKSVLKGVKNTASTVKEAVVDSADFVAKAFVGGTDHSRIKKKHEKTH
ncbi:hypothetical protein BGW41_001425 [Actinomortierella wolfii]|nr:hypothetical protein BGW41_001425 [Actinomortierella wolfii]